MTKKLRMIEAFAGIGSQIAAMKRLGVDVENVGISEIDKYAVQSYEAINGKVNNYGDITKVEKFDPTDLLIYSSPCFTEDALVFTKEGYKKIIDVKIGDEVLTHKNRWKSVTNFFDNGNKECVSVYGFGFTPLTCTLNHKFLVRKKYRKWNNTKRQYDRLFTNPEWVEAKDLDKNCYLGTPVFQNTENPIWDGITFNWSDGRKNRYKNEIESYINNPTFWWIIGRYIADGWNNKNGIKICCGKNEFFEIDSKFKELGISYTYTEERTVYKFQITKKEWSKFVEQFGNYAYGKYLPTFIFDLPFNLLKSFVDGYISGDGCLINNLFKGSSVSKNLIYGLQMCVYKLYKTPFRLYSYENKGSTIIENRKVKIKRCYEFAFKKEKRKQDKAFCENEYIWTPINKIEYVGRKHVYDITVDEDHSFLANNKVVHNCQDFSQAGLQKGLVDENGNQTRSGLLLEVARLLEEYQKSGEMPKYLLMENVKALVSKKFKDKFEMWLQALDLLGYNNYWKVLNAKDYGIPQNRERVFVVSIRKDIDKGTFSFPDKIPLQHRLKDLLETSVDEKYYISDEKVKKFIEKRIEQNNQATDDNVIRTGNCLRPDKETGGSFAGATYDPVGLAPTLNTMEGGNRQPFVEFGDKQPTEPFCVASRGRNPENPSDRTTGSPTEQRLEANTDFVCNTLTSVQKDSYVAEPSLQFVGGLGEPTRLLDGKELSRNYKQGYRVYDSNGISAACTTGTGGLAGESPALFTEEARVKHLGNINRENSHGGFAGDVFDKEQLCPTLNTMSGGNRQPYIEEACVKHLGNIYQVNSHGGFNGDIFDSKYLSPTLTTMYKGSKPPYIEEVKIGNGIGSNNAPKIIEENETIPTGQLSLFETYSYTKQTNIGSSENQVVSDLKETMNKQDVSYCIDANYWKGSTIDNFIDKHRRQLVMDCDEPNVLTPKRTEYGKAIRKEYEAGNIQESRHNMTEMQPRTDGISNTITTVQKDNMLCEPKERFFKQAIETFEQNECDAGDTVDAFNKRINSSGCSPTLTTRPEGFKTAILPVVDDNRMFQQGAILSNYATKLEKITDVAGTLMARDYKGFGNQTTNGVIENDTTTKAPSLRIRKLTPKECWRLMGFTDEEHDAAVQAGVSASQRYKQAGNSIVVQCLCFIFWKLLQGTEYEPENGFKTDWLEELFK